MRPPYSLSLLMTSPPQKSSISSNGPYEGRQKVPQLQNGHMPCIHSIGRTLFLRISFGFRISDFEFLLLYSEITEREDRLIRGNSLVMEELRGPLETVHQGEYEDHFASLFLDFLDGFACGTACSNHVIENDNTRAGA